MKTISLLAISLFLFFSCTDSDVVDDVDQTVALKNVELDYDTTAIEILLPEGALTSGKTFDELYKEDSAKYANLENYGVSFNVNMEADNTKDNAKDAKFDGMDLDLVFNNISDYPVTTAAGPFTVKAKEILPVSAQNSINLKTHKPVGIYIFSQVVDGNDLFTRISPTLYYNIGKEGTIPLPEIEQYIPTRASDETKAFLKGFLESQLMTE